MTTYSTLIRIEEILNFAEVHINLLAKRLAGLQGAREGLLS